MLVGTGHYLVFLTFALFIFFLTACGMSWFEGKMLGSFSLYPPPSARIDILLYSQTRRHNLITDGGEGG